MKLRNGFTLVELLVAIAVLTVLVSIAIPRYNEIIATARGSQILANMQECETVCNIYYTRNGAFPENINELVGIHIASWPKPPSGLAIIEKSDGSKLQIYVRTTKYIYVKPIENAELYTKIGRITLGGMTIEEILSTSESSLTLTDG